MRGGLRRHALRDLPCIIRNVVKIPLNLNGIMTIFWKAEVDSPTYLYIPKQVCWKRAIGLVLGRLPTPLAATRTLITWSPLAS